jgi:hypothetical protein
LAKWFWRRFLNDPTLFLHFCDYLPFEEDLTLFSRRRFLRIVSLFLLFRYHLPLEKGYPLHLNKLESPAPKDDLYQVWLKLAQWFWRRFLNDPILFSHFCDYFFFEEDLALYFNKLEFPSSKDNLYHV